jgi:hypothetical protein
MFCPEPISRYDQELEVRFRMIFNFFCVLLVLVEELGQSNWAKKFFELRLQD